MSLPADGVNANALTETTTIPTGKKLIFLDPDTNEGGIITLENLTKQILSNLATQTFNLDQGTKTLLAALNELNSNGKYEGIFTLKPSIAMTFPIKMRHAYVLLFKYIDQDTIKSIRACIVCSKQREDAEGMTLWLTQETESITMLIETESCSVTSKNSWIALSVHEL